MSRIGIVTVLYNSSAVLPDFFASLNRQTYRDYHLWAVDNASTDDSIEQCRAQGDHVTIIPNDKNLGVAAGNNQGIQAALSAGCAYILLLNNDVEFGPPLFSQLIAGIELNQCQMTTPIIYYFDRPQVVWAAGGKFQPILGYRCYHLFEGVEDLGQFTQPMPVEHAPTCCVLLTRSVFERVGFMDERYFVYHDDTDFMLRCLKAKQKLYLLPNAKLLHKVSSLTGGARSEFSIEMSTRNRVYMLSKFLGRIMALPYVVGLSFLYLFLRLCGRYDSSLHRIKQRSLREGFKMARNWGPYG